MDVEVGYTGIVLGFLDEHNITKWNDDAHLMVGLAMDSWNEKSCSGGIAIGRTLTLLAKQMKFEDM